jgi:hypothetical protein
LHISDQTLKFSNYIATPKDSRNWSYPQNFKSGNQPNEPKRRRRNGSGVSYLCGTRRASRRPWLSRTSAALAAEAEGMVPCEVSRRARWMRNPLPPLPPPPPGKDTAATAAAFEARRLDLIRSSLAPPEQKHHPEPSPKTPIRLRWPPPCCCYFYPGGRRGRLPNRGREPWTSTERDTVLPP